MRFNFENNYNKLLDSEIAYNIYVLSIKNVTDILKFLKF